MGIQTLNGNMVQEYGKCHDNKGNTNNFFAIYREMNGHRHIRLADI